MYWDKVLKEVLNKHDTSYPCLFTNLRKCEDVAVELSPSRFYRRKIEGEFRIYLGKGRSRIYFTRRECECIVLLLEGKTMKEVGAFLDLSARTVEYYVKNMKIKLKCRTKSELISTVLMSDFRRRVKGLREQMNL